MPKPPRSIPGIAVFPGIARVCQHLDITPRELDERLSVDDVFDVLDLISYLHDCDNPPMVPPPPKPGG